jgi:hypothetical protein
MYVSVLVNMGTANDTAQRYSLCGTQNLDTAVNILYHHILINLNFFATS